MQAVLHRNNKKILGSHCLVLKLLLDYWHSVVDGKDPFLQNQPASLVSIPISLIIIVRLV